MSAWPFPRVIAHRGGGSLAPENTIAGLLCGVMHGYRAAEFDVMCSADGVPLLMHDEVLGRTVPGTGAVSDQPAAVLQALDAGAWKAPAFAGEPVPLFSQAIEFCCANGIWMNVEIKPAPGFAVVTGQAVAATLAAYLQSKVLCSKATVATPLVSSFSFDALMAARQTAPQIPRGLLMDGLAPDWLCQARQLQAVALHLNHEHLDAGVVRAVKAEGLGLFCYTVNDAARARTLFDWGVDAICTDRLDLIPADFT